MGVAVTITYASWVQIFPQFSVTVPKAIFDGFLWPTAQQFCRNDGCGQVNNTVTQTTLLQLMLAHLAQLFFGSSGTAGSQPQSPLVGRITDASEGSVSVSTEMQGTVNSAWFYQTSFGAAFWQLALPFRLGRYFPKVTPVYQPIGNPYPPYISSPSGQ
jgi:hypothetical protein